VKMPTDLTPSRPEGAPGRDARFRAQLRVRRVGAVAASRLCARTLCGLCFRLERIARPPGAIARGCTHLRRAPRALSENELQPAALNCRCGPSA
jgi:hypothetical protein